MHGLRTLLHINNIDAPAKARPRKPPMEIYPGQDCWTCKFCGKPIALIKEKYSVSRGIIHYLIAPKPCSCQGAEMARLISGN